jgi:C-terminal processing protease CtpA/Prc
LGVTLKITDNIIVTYLTPGFPAIKTKIAVGDEIIQIDEKNKKSMGFDLVSRVKRHCMN